MFYYYFDYLKRKHELDEFINKYIYLKQDSYRYRLTSLDYLTRKTNNIDDIIYLDIIENNIEYIRFLKFKRVPDRIDLSKDKINLYFDNRYIFSFKFYTYKYSFKNLPDNNTKEIIIPPGDINIDNILYDPDELFYEYIEPKVINVILVMVELNI